HHGRHQFELSQGRRLASAKECNFYSVAFFPRQVTDLKQLLKARGLSIVGVKSELIQRLEAAMLTAPSGVAAGTAKAIEKEIDEDAILAGDDEGFTKPDES